MQITVTGDGQPSTHFETIGLDQVKRPQQPIEARQDPQMLLGVAHVGGRQAVGIQALIDVAAKGVQGGPGVVWGEWRVPGAKSLCVQLGQRRADLHQRAKVWRRPLAKGVDQLGGAIQEIGLSRFDPGVGSLEIKRFGGRNDQQHHRLRGHSDD